MSNFIGAGFDNRRRSSTIREFTRGFGFRCALMRAEKILSLFNDKNVKRQLQDKSSFPFRALKLENTVAQRILRTCERKPLRLRLESIIFCLMIELDMIAHVHLKVAELKRSVKFYTEVLGFRVAERAANFAFLTLSNRHHDLALQEVGTNAPRPAPHAIGLFHFAFELPDLRALAEAYVMLNEAGVRITGAMDYGISKTIYFADPDGNGIALYVDTRHERPKWSGISQPLDIEALLALRQTT